jgi:pimeloyl-ACP methyl ester carboxylesterase
MKKLSIGWILLVLLFAASALAFDEKAAIKSNFADFGGVKIHYQETGKGNRALIFVHGWTCNSDFWKESINAFPGRRVIAVDLPGHGKSDKPQVSYTMDYFARSIEAVMKNAKVDRAVLVGHSMGTPIIRQFYRLYPKKTLGLVIVDGALRPFMPKAQMEAFFAPLKADYKNQAARFVDGMLQPIKDEKLKQEIRASMLATPDYVAISAMEGMMDEKIYEPDQIKVPVLAIMAESPFWQPDTDTFYRKIAPTIDFRMWQGVSHFLMMEKPQLFNKSVLLYLGTNKLL